MGIYWLGINSNLTDVTNYQDDDGVNRLPVTGDNLAATGSTGPASNTSGLSSVHLTSFTTLNGFTGSWGDGTNIPIFAGIDTIYVNSPAAGNIYLNAGACDSLYIQDCGQSINSCHVYDGTYSFVSCQRGMIKIGVNANISTLEVTEISSPTDAKVIIESGASIDIIQQSSGYIQNNGIRGMDGSGAYGLNLEMGGGTFDHVCDRSYASHLALDIANLTMYSTNANFRFLSQGGKIWNAVIRAGKLSVQGAAIERIRTIESLEVRSAGVVDLRNGSNMIHIADPVVMHGGQFLGSAGVDFTVPA